MKYSTAAQSSDSSHSPITDDRQPSGISCTSELTSPGLAESTEELETFQHTSLFMSVSDFERNSACSDKSVHLESGSSLSLLSIHGQHSYYDF